MNDRSPKGLGRLAEDMAADFFISRGYTVLERNYRTPVGEIDLIVKGPSQIVFAEVKARRGNKCGRPEEAVTPGKQTKISRAASMFLQSRGWLDRDIRFDVVAITFVGSDETKINHIPWAFDVQA